MSISECCLKGFKWDGTPVGKVEPFPTSSNQAYVTGENPNVAIMLIHDLLSWNFPNTRLLADHFAQEADATVYVPDFFGDESFKPEDIFDLSKWKEIGVPEFTARNSREIRSPEIIACAEHLRSKYKKVGAAGYCFGGWAVFYLGRSGRNLMDCIVAGHPTWLTKDDIDNVAVPTQILAPEIDPVYNADLKQHTWTTLQANSVAFDYQHFPGVEHACFTRGDSLDEKNKIAMARGKSAAVSWFRQWLHDPVEMK